jgi:hemolysin D
MASKFSKMFGPDNLEYEFLPAALEIQDTPPSPLRRLLIWLILIIVIATAVWSYLGQVEIVAVARGKVIPDGRLKVLQPMEEGVVKAIHVADGQRVKAGQVLIELDPTLKGADVQSSALSLHLQKSDKERLVRELHGGGSAAGTSSFQGRLQTSRELEFRSREDAQRQVVAQRESALEAGRAILSKLEKTLAIVVEQEAAYHTLFDNGVASKMELQEKQKELVAVTQELESQKKLVQQARESLQEARHNLEVIRSERSKSILTDIVEREKYIAAAQGEATKAQRRFDLETLVAPVDGVVHGLKAYTIGGVVKPAEDIVSVVPDGTPYVIEVQVLNQDIGFVRVGQDAEIKLDTFPFQKYGTIKGKVMVISPDAIEDQKLGPVYRVRVQPTRFDLMVDGRMVSMSPGMSCTVEVKTGQRRIIEFFLSPIIKYAKESLILR